LKILIQVRTPPKLAHLSKVQSHAGIVGDKCADAVAKYQARKVDASHADTVMPCVSIGGNPFYDITWLAFEGNKPLNTTIP